MQGSQPLISSPVLNNVSLNKFEVTCDASGKNAIVSKVKDPHLLEKGLCVGAVVTHIEDLEVIGNTDTMA